MRVRYLQSDTQVPTQVPILPTVPICSVCTVLVRYNTGTWLRFQRFKLPGSDPGLAPGRGVSGPGLARYCNSGCGRYGVTEPKLRRYIPVNLGVPQAGPRHATRPERLASGVRRPQKSNVHRPSSIRTASGVRRPKSRSGPDCAPSLVGWPEQSCTAPRYSITTCNPNIIR